MASRGLNKVQIIGNLGTDPEMKYTPTGKAVTKIRVAVGRPQAKDSDRQPDTDWFTVIAWEQLAEIMNQYLQKGSRVYIEGRLQTRNYAGDQGQKIYVTEIIAGEMIMLDPPKHANGTGGAEQAAVGVPADADDDMPF